MDDRGHLRSVELIALPGTQLSLLHEEPDGIAAVTLKDYSKKPLYIDQKALTKKNPSITIPNKTRTQILNELLKKEGAPYVWGGNWAQGIPSLLKWYPPAMPISDELEKKWILQGVDCSGLLYEVTGGITPRNSEDLLSFGKSISCKNQTPLQLASLLKPLDFH